MTPREASAVAELEGRLLEFLSDPQYPCLGARSVVKRSGLTVVEVESMTDLDRGHALERITSALQTAARSQVPGCSRAPVEPGVPTFCSTAVVFAGPVARSEREFEATMWSVLQRLAAADTVPWAPEVSSDPDDPNYGFSFAGAAFFVVGMHPAASRRARRSPSPTLVFNGHAQFTALRESGSFERMRDTIRRRDVRWQGSVNPMMADHGQASEARQYAGRVVPDNWSPPVTPLRAAS